MAKFPLPQTRRSRNGKAMAPKTTRAFSTFNFSEIVVTGSSTFGLAAKKSLILALTVFKCSAMARDGGQETGGRSGIRL
jgi:hypothetical protein